MVKANLAYFDLIDKFKRLDCAYHTFDALEQMNLTASNSELDVS